MSLSQRTDLTERGDFLKVPTFRLGRLLQNELSPFSANIDSLYRRRHRRIEKEQQQQMIEVREQETSSSWVRRTPSSSLELTVGDLVPLLSKTLTLPWASIEHGYVDTNLRNLDALGLPKLVLTGSQTDILNHKRWKAHEAGYECESCGKDFTNLPWQGYQNLCTECHHLLGFDRLRETTPYPFEGAIEELKQRRYRNSFQLSMNHTLWVDTGELVWEVEEF